MHSINIENVAAGARNSVAASLQLDGHRYNQILQQAKDACVGEDVEESEYSTRASQQAQNEMKEYDKLRRTFLVTISDESNEHFKFHSVDLLKRIYKELRPKCPYLFRLALNLK